MTESPVTPVATSLPVAPLPPGHRIGHFELQGLRGGADGSDRVLYRGWDRVLARPVAVAEYLPHGLARRNGEGVLAPASPAAAAAYAAGLERFADDTRRLAGIDHPHLQRVLHLLRDNGSAYAVMPWYHGQPLLALRQRMFGPPDEAALRTLLEELLGALQAMHRAGQRHGSLHPAGVLMRDDDRALLLGPDPAAIAAADFRAPECGDPGAGTEPGPWSDVYSLAQLARFTVTGLLPAPGIDPAEPLAATVERLFFDQPQVRFTPSLLQVLDLAAAADPAHRPHSAEQFLAWLAQPPAAARVAAAPSTAPPIAPFDDVADKATAPEPAPEAPPDSALTGGRDPDPAPARDANIEADADAEAEDDAETIDPATAEAIQRLIDSIPPLRIDPPPGVQPPTARMRPPEDLRAPPRPSFERPRRRLAPWLLAVGIGVTVAAAWAMHEPALQWLTDWRAPATGEPLDTPRDPQASTDPLPAQTATEPPPGDDVIVERAPPAPADAADAALTAAERPQDTATGAPVGSTGGVAAETTAEAMSPPPVATPDDGTNPGTNDTTGSGNTGPTAPDPGTTAAVAPPAPAADPPRPATPSRRAAAPSSPRAVCGDRTPFSLYRCMQSQCARAAWRQHPQCVRLAREDRVD